MNNYRKPRMLDKSIEVYQLEIQNVLFFEKDNYLIYKYYVGERSYIVKMKKNLNQIPKKCIMFFHGSKDLHWDCAILSTDMVDDDYIVVYLQGNNQGVYQLEPPHVDKDYGYISYGNNYFEIRDFADNFDADIKYVQDVIQDVGLKYDLTKFYAVGHSNGGVFVCLFPIYLPGKFIAIISHQGGMGWDEHFNIPFEKIDEKYTKPHMFFFTGSDDIHLTPCIQAHNIFTIESFDSVLHIEPNLTHTWRKIDEKYIFDFFNKF